MAKGFNTADHSCWVIQGYTFQYSRSRGVWDGQMRMEEHAYFPISTLRHRSIAIYPEEPRAKRFHERPRMLDFRWLYE